MDQLDILREEMNELKRNLDKEQIVNDRLLRSVMKHKASWLNTFVKVEFILLPIFYIIFAMACKFFGVSQWYALTFIVLGIIDSVFDLRTLRISPKVFSTFTMMEVRKILIRQKKERFIQTCVSLPLVIIWLTLFATAILKENSSIESVVVLSGGIIGGIVGAILGILLYRKAQSTNDTLIDDTFDMEQ